jgi:hypothetical protein
MAPLLEHVGPACGTRVEQPQGPVRLQVLREQHDTEPRAGAGQLLGHPDALVALPGRHPHVGEHRVRPVRGDGGAQLVRGRHAGDEIEVVLRREQQAKALADQVAVLRGDHADPHRSA